MCIVVRANSQLLISEDFLRLPAGISIALTLWGQQMLISADLYTAVTISPNVFHRKHNLERRVLIYELPTAKPCIFELFNTSYINLFPNYLLI